MNLNEESFLCYFNLCSVLMGRFGPFIQMIGIVFIVLLFNFIAKKFLLKLCQHFHDKQLFWASNLVAAVLKPLTYLIWYIVIVCLVDNIASSLGGFHLIKMGSILSFGAILALGWFLLGFNARLTKAMIDRSQRHLTPMEPGKLDLVGKLITASVILFILLLLMELTGYSVQTLIAFGGIGGLALAFASQQIISNFFGGLMVYVTQPFTIGERIELPAHKLEGYVEEIGWYLTKIRNLEKQPIYLSNSIITQTAVITHSRKSHDRFHPIIRLRYEDFSRVKPIVDEIKLMLLKHPHVDQNALIEVAFIGFSSSALDIEISAFISKTSGTSFKNVRQDLLLKIGEIIYAAGAEIAFDTENSSKA